MLTFSVNKNKGQEAYILKVKEAIDKNINYFKKFNGSDWEEAVQRTLITAIQNQNDEYDDVEPYIKNLARNVLKTYPQENPYDMITEDGEVSYPYLGLVSYIDEGIFVDNKEIEDTFKELYLLYKEDFLKIGTIFNQDNFEKHEVVRNQKIVDRIMLLEAKYSAKDVITLLSTFLSKLPEYTNQKYAETIKTVEMKERKTDIMETLPDIPTIKDEDGNYIGINKETLTMDVDPDYINWDTIAQTSCNIMKIDITPLMDYMYKQIFVPQGVNTKHIEWCGDMYKVTTPAGESFVNIDRYKFMQRVRAEIVENFVDSMIHYIVALSPDSIYIKPPRLITYDYIRLILFTGRVIDLPVSMYIQNRGL